MLCMDEKIISATGFIRVFNFFFASFLSLKEEWNTLVHVTVVVPWVKYIIFIYILITSIFMLLIFQLQWHASIRPTVAETDVNVMATTAG